MHPAFSLDGGWIAFQSDRSGQNEVYLKRFPESGGLIQVSNRGGGRPIWSSDGRRLFFLANDASDLHEVELTLGPEPQIGKPAFVTEIPPASRPRSWQSGAALAPGDDRLVVVRREERNIEQLAVILDWFSEIRRLAP